MINLPSFIRDIREQKPNHFIQIGCPPRLAPHWCRPPPSAPYQKQNNLDLNCTFDGTPRGGHIGVWMGRPLNPSTKYLLIDGVLWMATTQRIKGPPSPGPSPAQWWPSCENWSRNTKTNGTGAEGGGRGRRRQRWQAPTNSNNPAPLRHQLGQIQHNLFKFLRPHIYFELSWQKVRTTGFGASASATRPEQNAPRNLWFVHRRTYFVSIETGITVTRVPTQNNLIRNLNAPTRNRKCAGWWKRKGFWHRFLSKVSIRNSYVEPRVFWVN